MKRLTVPLALILLLAVSCNQRVQPSRQTIPFVSGLIANRSLPQSILVSGAHAYDPSGAIYVVGPAERCNTIALELMRCDVFDNVNGSLCADGLPDFSGETVCAVKDSAFTPYSQWVERGQEDILREITVRSVISAFDTVCYVSPFDREGLSVRPRAKQFILCSPHMAAYGKFDCDTLFKSFGVLNPVICPLELMLDQLASSLQRPFNVGVIALPGESAQQSYSQAVSAWAHSRNLDGTVCTAIEVSYGADSTEVVRNWMDSYAAQGGTRPLDALIVDDYTLDCNAIAVQARELYSVMNEQSMAYGNFFADGFRIIDPLSAIARACYGSLRANNAFTHRIAFPITISMSIVEDSERYVQD